MFDIIVSLNQYWNEIKLHSVELLTVYVACLVAFTSPGPNFATVTSYAVKSKTAGYGAAFGISMGTGIWALFAATGITVILANLKHSVTIVSVLGGAYLMWLGYGSLKSVFEGQKFQNKKINTEIKSNFLHSFMSGLLIQLTNPKSALFWIAVTSLAIRPDTPAIIVIALTLGCWLLASAWHGFLALAFSSGPLREVYIKNKPVFSTIFGVVFIGYGLRVFYTLFVHG